MIALYYIGFTGRKIRKKTRRGGAWRYWGAGVSSGTMTVGSG
jgi:hypothetical protein